MKKKMENGKAVREDGFSKKLILKGKEKAFGKSWLYCCMENL